MGGMNSPRGAGATIIPDWASPLPDDIAIWLGAALEMQHRPAVKMSLGSGG